MTLFTPRTLRIGAIRNPYKPFRIPRRDAVAIPEIALPPAPITPTIANCDAPEKVNSESRQVWRSENPAAILAAPNAVP